MKAYISDIVILILWIAFSIFLVVGSFLLGIGDYSRPGPGFMPLLIGVFIGLISILALGSTVKNRSNMAGPKLFTFDQLRNPIKVYGAIAGYALMLNVFGYIISTAIFMFFLFKFVLPQRLIPAFIATIVTVLSSYLIFVEWLKCQFPTIFF
jgi:hypothetical protein